MTTYGPTTPETDTILELVADLDHPSVAWEFDYFDLCLAQVARANGGVVSQNAMRPLLRHKVAPKRIGAAYRLAIKEGRLVTVGWDQSDDIEGRNAGRPCRRFVAPEYVSDEAA